MTQTQTAPAKPAEASPAKPLFGFCALLADLAHEAAKLPGLKLVPVSTVGEAIAYCYEKKPVV